MSGFDLLPKMLTRGDERIARRYAGLDAARDAFHLHRAVRVDEQRDGIAVPVAHDGPHPVHRRAEAAVGPALHQIAGVDHDGVRDRRREAPLARAIANFQPPLSCWKSSVIEP